MSVDFAATNAAAARIRTEAPLAGTSMTNDECIRWNELEAQALAELGNVPVQHAWRYCLHENGEQYGVWSHSDMEAALKCALSWGLPVVAVSAEPFPDSTTKQPIFEEVSLW